MLPFLPLQGFRHPLAPPSPNFGPTLHGKSDITCGPHRFQRAFQIPTLFPHRSPFSLDSVRATTAPVKPLPALESPPKSTLVLNRSLVRPLLYPLLHLLVLIPSPDNIVPNLFLPVFHSLLKELHVTFPSSIVLISFPGIVTRL